MVRTERAAIHRRPGEYGLVYGGGRRWFLYPSGSHRLGDRLRRIAGRQHEPARSARRHAKKHPSECGPADGAAERQSDQPLNNPTPGGHLADAEQRAACPGSSRQPKAARPAADGGGRGGAPNVVKPPPKMEAFRFYWNAPMEISPHNPGSDLHGGAVLLQIHQPRRYVVDEFQGSEQEPQSMVARDGHHGRAGR